MKTLETDRLILRKWELRDLEDFYEYARNSNVGPKAGWEPHSSREVSKRILDSFIEKEEVWAIVYKENSKVIGSIGIHEDRKRSFPKARMLGYVLSENYWGKGIMTEAAMVTIEYAFEGMKLDLLSIYHYTFNIRSKRVIEKCGFTYEGTLRSASQIYSGEVYDSDCYSMTKEEFYNRHI